ncbi:heterokaryon incompatibility protein-domain-containing protein [Podospora appendiculata]|uniref:Heterokaryon incompatibility protein-domain-containing protein n=1 Tax=Podospora appendiculata TaxID=314037 RepID=A0AAE1CCS2_9PEZI|nr:heterokaryon incompatibility protein-domain-containing protein [Podospora appendiculata]
MRLINVASYEVEEFYGSAVPKYAILSHTWGDVEASFQEWTSRLTRLRKMKRPGFSKVVAACRQARAEGLRYAWVDTVCIDKSSSAELSEAINSMYAWYLQAKVCYVYLSDVTDHPADNIDALDMLRHSRWFSRGWTLQEMLAPANLVFYSREWTLLGTKNALAVLIARVTGIDEVCIHKKKRLDEYSIAQRMAWAANRQTTRPEDMAYCLLGIFNISMPLLYGEGSKAFRRLQEEILKVSDDHSILSFDTNLSDGSLFAHHPSVFRDGGRVHPNHALKLTAPFSMTNAGLSIATPLIQTLSPYWVLAVLNCVEVDDDNNNDKMQRSVLCLPLFGKDKRFMRARTPVSLISKRLDAPSLEARDSILDLTTRTETNYFISYFSRVYSVYGTEMDVAMKGFDLGASKRSHSHRGFMIAFPRGMAGYHLHAAFPARDLHRDISFFIPTTYSVPNLDRSYISLALDDDGETPPSPRSEFPLVADRGILVFQNPTTNPPTFVGIYLALERPLLARWTAKVIPIPASLMMLPDPPDEDHILNTIDAQTYDHPWPHYDLLGDVIVSAGTRFDPIGGEPCKETIMAEIVFDADAVLRERDQL